MKDSDTNFAVVTVMSRSRLRPIFTPCLCKYMEGYLQKWVNYIYGWKRRYFMLQDGVLLYCHEKGAERKGAVHLEVAAILPHPKHSSRLIIHTGCTQLHLKAENSEEAQAWIEALQAAKRDKPGPEPDFPAQATEVLLKLSSLQGKLAEDLDSLPDAFKEHPQLQSFFRTAKEFKYTVAQALTLFPLSPPPPLMPPTDEDAFEDAKSHLSDTEMFCDAREDTLSSVDIPYRKTLPFLRNPNQRINIWKVVRDSIGKELSKMAVPVYFNEPISFLQRFSEDLIYHELLLQAAAHSDPLWRLAYIACFAVSGYSVTSDRHMKPFNPLLGETFELQRDGFRLISEQVSHHPPVSALHCEHPQYHFWGCTEIKTVFRGTYLLVHPAGPLHVKLISTGETFTWEKPNSSVHNIIFGKMYVDHHGEMAIANEQTGDLAKVVLKKKGWFDKDPHRVEGVICDALGAKCLTIEGKWSEALTIKDLRTGAEQTGWTMQPFQEGYEYNYYFTDFTIQLNLPPQVFPQPIAQTDSRYRPDQRALEFGALDTAASEKVRVEEKQRQARKEREAASTPYFPRWFRLEDGEWRYCGNYWEQKEAGVFTDLPDIF